MRKITRKYLKNLEEKDFSKVDNRQESIMNTHELKFEQVFVGVNSVNAREYKIGITHSIKRVNRMALLSEGISMFITDNHWESYKNNDSYGLLYNPEVWIKVLND